MNRTAPSVIAIAIVGLAFSLGAVPTDTTSDQKSERSKKVREVYERKFGGFVVQPGSQIGRIVFVNAQKSLPREEIDRVVKTITEEMKYYVDVIEEPPLRTLPTQEDIRSLGYNVAIFIVESSAYPALLVSPEENWSLVNVQRLKAGLKDDAYGKRFFALRGRGELLRGFAQACGIWTSNYNDNLLNAKRPEELDGMKVDALVVDIVQRCQKHLKSIGVTPARTAMYTRACQEGWAPAPTNEFQRAIWNKVHKIPDRPLTIEYDPKRDR